LLAMQSHVLLEQCCQSRCRFASEPPKLALNFRTTELGKCIA